jgi:hypothetical protein
MFASCCCMDAATCSRTMTVTCCWTMLVTCCWTMLVTCCWTMLVTCSWTMTLTCSWIVYFQMVLNDFRHPRHSILYLLILLFHLLHLITHRRELFQYPLQNLHLRCLVSCLYRRITGGLFRLCTCNYPNFYICSISVISR